MNELYFASSLAIITFLPAHTLWHNQIKTKKLSTILISPLFHRERNRRRVAAVKFESGKSVYVAFLFIDESFVFHTKDTVNDFVTMMMAFAVSDDEAAAADDEGFRVVWLAKMGF